MDRRGRCGGSGGGYRDGGGARDRGRGGAGARGAGSGGEHARRQHRRRQPAAAPQGPVVALGDSYTAGDIMPLSLTSQPLGCLRSSKSYPVQVAKALGAKLVDAACGSAGVKEMTQAQQTYLGTNPPQLSALAPDDRLVMLTLGGDDMGFMHVLDECMMLSITNPFGSPCESHYTSGGTDQLAARVAAEAPRLTAVLQAIHSRAPGARVLLVGYPDMFPQQGGCWPAVPITDGDIAYLRGIEGQINGMLARAAAATGDHLRRHLHADDRARLLPAPGRQGRGRPDPGLAHRALPPEHPWSGRDRRRGARRGRSQASRLVLLSLPATRPARRGGPAPGRPTG